MSDTLYCDWPQCECSHECERQDKHDEYLKERAAMATVLWLIEHPNNGNQRPFYWGNEEGEQAWTTDIEAAFKFATEGEADKHAGDVGIPDWRIVGHQWLDHTPTTKSVVGT